MKFCSPTNLLATADQTGDGVDAVVDPEEGLPDGQDDRDADDDEDHQQGRRQQDPGQPSLTVAEGVLLCL